MTQQKHPGPEVLAPAGDRERMEMAVRYGADAVYLAGRQFGMRSAAVNFAPEDLADSVAWCHARGAKVYVTCNTLPRNDELTALPAFLETVHDAGADALIMTDPGVFRMAEQYAPGVPRHVSTQAGVVNWASARMWHDLGASRVILARELTLEEIRGIRDHTPKELELEAFVHGSMCVSFSGRCLLSNYMTGRDGNRGECAQPCRWKYALMEETRPGEYFPVYEDDTGSYILNSRDLCMIDHVPELLACGLSSLKLEGRMKTAYYAAVISQAYRKAVDAAVAGEPLDPVWKEEVHRVSHRNYCTGFYYGRPDPGEYYEDSRYIRDYQVSAVVESVAPEGMTILSQRNRFCSGDTLELLIPGEKPISFTVGAMTDAEGTPITACPHPKMEVRLRLPAAAPPGTLLRRCCGENAPHSDNKEPV